MTQSAYKQLIDRALGNGYLVSVHDGEEWAVKRSKDRGEILEAVHSVDQCELLLRDPETRHRIGWALVCLYDLDPEETVVDYTDNEVMRTLVPQ